MKYIFIFLTISVLCIVEINCVVSNRKNNIEKIDSSNHILECVNQAWEVSWERFYHPQTNLFYDYLTSYDQGKELAHLPTANEVLSLYPNVQGYDTGMEDCMISAGVMLCMIIDKYDVTKEETLRTSAYEVFKGIQRCATVHGIQGFLARGVCTEDLKSIYIGTSRDQITHAVHGLWQYYNSSLANNKIKEEIRVILSSIADRTMQNVIPQNGYNFLRADGTPDNLLKMWDNAGHEAARLPMIYAAAWDATGNLEYFNQYQKYLQLAIERSFIDLSSVSSWALLQMQTSLELLNTLEKDPYLKKQMCDLMQKVSNEAIVRAVKANKNASKYDLTMIPADWRDGGGIKWESEYRKVWYNVRESGEAALMQLVDENKSFPEEQKLLLLQAITRLNYKQVSTSGIFYLQGAYWKARKREILL